jgi:hypothetical protein
MTISSSNSRTQPFKWFLRKSYLGQIRWFAGDLQFRETPRNLFTETLNL